MRYSIKEIFSDYSKQYNEKFGSADEYKESLKLFFNHCTKSETLLDLGCGPGNLSKILKDLNPKLKITGIDFSNEMLDIAKIRLKDDNFICADLRELPILKLKYDIVICAFAIPYLTQKEVMQLIKNISDLMNNHGKLYLSFMLGDNNSGYEDMSFAENNQTIVERHDKKTIYSQLEKNNFLLLNEIEQNYTEPNGSITKDIIAFFEKR